MDRPEKRYLQVMGSLRLIHGPASLLLAPGLLKCSLVQKGRQKSLLGVCWFARKGPRANLPPIPTRPVGLPPPLEYSRLISLSPNISTCGPELWHLGQGLWDLYVRLTSCHFDLAPYPVTDTACIKEYYEVKKYIENAVKSRNFISIFDTLRKFKSI